eukprot:COSAG01_NODE_8239_length_2860_cov_2.088012_1_plen_72_part_10
MPTAALQLLRERVSSLESEGAGLRGELAQKTERLDDALRMSALLRDQAHKQLGATEAAVRERERGGRETHSL